MSAIINPGSENNGGSFEQALENAKDWLDIVNKEYPEVTMTTKEDRFSNGWRFEFTHNVTGKSVDLCIHGYTEDECKEFVFHPRVYWNGSSTANPEKEDWLTDDYSYRVVYEKRKDLIINIDE